MQVYGRRCTKEQPTASKMRSADESNGENAENNQAFLK
jgi:hypothetical protein